jgi:hypothetical protein
MKDHGADVKLGRPGKQKEHFLRPKAKSFGLDVDPLWQAVRPKSITLE